MIVLQYLYAFALFGGVLVVIFKGTKLGFRALRYYWDISRRWSDVGRK